MNAHRIVKGKAKPTNIACSDCLVYNTAFNFTKTRKVKNNTKYETE
jgi:hypothetical protein